MTKTATRTLVFNGASQEAAEAADSIEAPWRTESFWRVNNADWEPHFYKLVIGRITSPGLHGSVSHDDVTVYFMADGSPVEDPESQPWEMNGNATRVGCDLLRALARQMTTHDPDLWSFLRTIEADYSCHWNPESPRSLWLRRLQARYDPAGDHR